MTAPFAAMALGWLTIRSPWIATGLFHGSMAAALWTHRKEWHPSQLRRGFRWIWLLAAVLLTALFGWCLSLRGNHIRPGLLDHGPDFGLAQPGLMPLVIYFCLLNPLLEEAFWRGLFSSNRLHPDLPDLAYGGFHFLIFLPFVPSFEALVAALSLALVGYGWRLTANRLGGLAIPILWHALGDIVLIFVLFRVAYGR